MVSGRKRKSPMMNLLSGVFSVAVLSAFVLLIAFVVNGLWNTDVKKISKSVGTILSRFHVPVNEEKLGNVAGEFVERISQTDLGSGVSDVRTDPGVSGASISSEEMPDTRSNVEGERIAIISDIHEDYDNLDKALLKIKEEKIPRVLILGDLTNYGDLANLTEVKNILENSGLDYYVLPGDHDIAQTLDDSNVVSVFGKTSQRLVIGEYSIMLLDNSPNFSTIPDDKIAWFTQYISDTDFLFLSQPLYTDGLNEPFSRMYMGSTKTPVSDPLLQQKQEAVLSQGIDLLSQIRSDQKLRAVIAGDHHKSNVLDDPVRVSLEHYFVGAVSSTVNDLPQAAIQTPRYSVMTLYEDGTFSISDVVL